MLPTNRPTKVAATDRTLAKSYPPEITTASTLPQQFKARPATFQGTGEKSVPLASPPHRTYLSRRSLPKHIYTQSTHHCGTMYKAREIVFGKCWIRSFLLEGRKRGVAE